MEHGPHTTLTHQSGDTFVGQSSEVGSLVELVRSGRSVVLSGPPGIGKSRLARRVAEEMLPGEWSTIDLHRATSVDDAWEAVAMRFDVDVAGLTTRALAESAGRAVRARGLQGVVLDGCDVLGNDGDLLLAFVRGARTPVIVTTRRRFALGGATLVELGGLSRSDGVALFEQQAARWTSQTGPRDDIVRLVERFDGNPLAIALAASRADVFSASQLLERLGEDKALRPRRGSDLSSLDEAIRSSWELLSDEERCVLQWLSAFKAPFSTRLAEVLAAPEIEFLEVASVLVDGSWLVRLPTTFPQLRMWDSMRRFVLGTLDEEARDETRRRFVSRVLGHVRELDQRAAYRGGQSALRSLQHDEENVLRALDLAMAAQMPEAVELAVASQWLARTTQRPQEISQRLERMLESAPRESVDSGRIRAIVGEIVARGGDMERASELLETAYVAVEGADVATRAEVARLSSVPLAAIDEEAARERLTDALELIGDSDPVIRGQLLERLGFLALRSFRLGEARDLLAQGSKLLRQHGSLLLQGPVTVGLAYVAMRTGHVEGAVSAFHKSVEIFAQSGAVRREAEARFNHGVALLALGDLSLAREQLERAREVWRRCAEERYLAIVGGRLALVAIESAEFETARRELRDAIALGQDSGDWNNRAIAEAHLVLVELAESGRVQSLARVEAALADLEFEADPDAAATALLLKAIGDAQRGDTTSSRDNLDRLAAVMRQIGDEDAYLNGVVETLASIGEVWREVELGREEVELAARGIRARVPSLMSDADRADDEIAQLPHPLVRICARALLRRLNRPDTVESLPEPVSFLGMMPPSSAESVVTIHRLGHWFRVDDGEVVDLVARRPFRLILKSILKSHMSDGIPGRAVAELVEAGWPGEIVEETSGKNRVYNAIRQLRALGLEDALVTGDAGYRFSSKTALQVVDTTPSQVTPILGL